MKFRDLEKVRVIIKEATDLDISYAYDDLVFPDHSAFLIKFDNKDFNSLHCYFHEDCLPKEKDIIFKKLERSCWENDYNIVNAGRFYMEQKGEEVELHFN